MVEEKQRLEQLVKSQLAMIDKQSKEIERMATKCEVGQDENKACHERISDLELRIKDKTELEILFEDAALITTKTRWTVGNTPNDRPCNSLICAAGALSIQRTHRRCSPGGRLVLFGGSEGPFEIYTLEMSSLTWTEESLPKISSSRFCGQSVCPLSRSKVIVYGGFKDDELTSDVAILNTESMNWTVQSYLLISQPGIFVFRKWI